jgi:hypothetical protein
MGATGRAPRTPRTPRTEGAGSEPPAMSVLAEDAEDVEIESPTVRD